MQPPPSTSPNKNIDQNIVIKEINQLRNIVEIEKELTQSLQDVLPYIWSSYRTMKHTTRQGNISTGNVAVIPPDVLKLLKEHDSQHRINNSSHHIRVRPIPRTLEQVQAIISVGRSYSNRTSAPAGWTSTTPLIHFTTPNPLPHQLRHSALATLQLQRTIDAATREQERVTQLKRKYEQEAISKRTLTNENNNNDTNDMDIDMNVSTNDTAGNKNPRMSSSVPHPVSSSVSMQPPPSRPRQQPPPRTTQISMNLSDDESSSSEEE